MKLRPGNYGKETSFEVRTFDAEMPLDEYARLPKHPLYLVLDNLRSAFNVGSIFRTADAGRLSGIYTCGYTAHPPHPKLDKTALGTLSYIETRHFATTLEAIEHLRVPQVPVWALEDDIAKPLLHRVRVSASLGPHRGQRSPRRGLHRTQTLRRAGRDSHVRLQKQPQCRRGQCRPRL